ncbi:MAG: helix-turn-helix transcriptional regulator [Clostridia bacterium]|nr:helix-turn-helix transcriptional regulator [Clostridia bacterium]
MDFLKCDALNVTRIVLAICVHKGTPVHRDRPSHGLALHTAGEADYAFEGGVTLHARPGSVVYLPRASSYTVTGESRETYAINFELAADEAFAPFVLDVGEVALLKHFREAERAWCCGGAGADAACRAALYAIVAYLQREHAARYLGPRVRSLLARAEHFIAQRYTDPSLRVSMIAAELGVSEVYLRRLFEERHGESPMAYVRACRMRRASELILSGTCSMREVAEQSGFGDYSYFCREFKRETGYAPTRYATRDS